MDKIERLNHLNGLRAIAGKPPLRSWKKSSEALEAAILELTPAVVEEPVVELPKTAETTKSPRGAIGQMVMRLLEETGKSYGEIVDDVKATYPDAKTTARSIASVAADMRRSGINIKDRRHKPAAA